MEHLREFQDYMLAYRLRILIGGKLTPQRKPLSLAEYAKKRLARQQLARELLGTSDYRERMKKVDALTQELNFGFWQNPNETILVLKQVIKAGGCKALESKEAFIEELLSKLERSKLTPWQETLIATYYLGLFQASAAYLDAEVFTRLRSEIDPLREQMPLFVETSDHPLPV